LSGTIPEIEVGQLTVLTELLLEDVSESKVEWTMHFFCSNNRACPESISDADHRFLFLPSCNELYLQNKFTGTMAESVCNLRTSGQGMLDDVWVDCGANADPRLECDAPGCCTACFPSGP